MVPSHTAGEERRERDAKELERLAASWSEAERGRVRSQQAALDAWQGSSDSPEALAALPRLELSDISPEPEEYPTVSYTHLPSVRSNSMSPWSALTKTPLSYLLKSS